jgi:hypothetical protein
MKKSLLILIILTFFSGLAQNNLDEKLINYFKLDRENIHLHLNKTIYSSNETVWFKGYIIEKKESKLNFLTTNVHVRLLDSNKKEIFNKLFYAANGTIIGQFNLDENLISGDYYIHTYTNYMNNFLEDESTLLKIKIINSKDKLVENNNSSSNIIIKYAFESGLFLENIDNLVGVSVKNCTGKGMKINKIEVINSKNETITTFATNQEGFGKFDLLNTTNDEYSLKFSYNNTTYTQLIGKPTIEGINLSVNSYAIEGKVLLKVKTNQSTLNKYLNSPFSILIQRNNFANSINFKLDKLTSDFIINKSELQEGINAVKLLNENSVLVSERFIFNQSTNKEKIIVESIIKRGDSISINAKIPNRVANLSVSALPINSSSNHNSNHIFSSIAFENYCDVEDINFDYYFENFNKRKEFELDLVLLHTLKSKYKWSDIINSVPKETYSFDVGINISGKINQTLNKKEKLKLRLFSINGLNEQTEINENNEFEFKNVLAVDSTNFHFSLIKNNEKLQNLNIYSRLSNNEKKFTKELQISALNCSDYSYTFNTELDDFPKLENTTQLEGISITETKKPKLENEREFNNGMAKGYKISDADYGSYRDVLSFIASHGYDVSIEGTGVVIRSRIVRTIMGTSSPAVFLDNSPVYDFSQLQNMLLNEIDEIYINKNGYGMGDNGINGSIRIYRKKGFYSPPRTNEVKSKSILITKGFQQLKSYKNPKYKDYKQDSFQKNGTIDWISNIYTNENGTFNFTIPHFNQEKIRLNIQGIDNLGQLYYQNIIIDVI